MYMQIHIAQSILRVLVHIYTGDGTKAGLYFIDSES